ncbi:retrovirus-related pol polyprotein from transposon TNT 1-94 [Tanacetum coccineum]
MSTHQDINALRAQQIANTHDPLAVMANTQTPFHSDQSSHITYIQHPQPNNNFVLQPSFNTNYLQHQMQNPKDILDPTTAFDMALELMSKAFQLNNTTTTNNNQRSSSNPCYSQIAQSGMNIDQDRQMLMVDDNVGNQFKENAVQNVGHLVGQNAVQNQGTQNVGNQNGLSVVSEIANQYGNGDVVTAPAEGNGNGINSNPIRCYNCRGEGHYDSNCTVKPRKKDAAYLQTQLKITQKEEAGIQLNSEEFDFMAAAGTQTDKAPIYDSDESAECGKSGGTVEHHPATPEETRALYDSVYNNLATEVEKVNSVNRKLRETNADLTTELARYKNQENSGKQITTLNEEISNLNKQLSMEKSTVSSLLEEKKRLKSDFKIREDELLDKQIQLENKIKELDNILVKMGQSIQTMHMLSHKPDSFYHTEQKMALGYQNSFYLKQAQQKQQSLYNGKVLLEKHDPPVVYDSEETLERAQESRLKIKQLNKEIKPANYTKINHLSGAFVSQTAKLREELYFSNTSKTANVSKSFSIPNKDFLDDTTPSVARKFLNEVKSTIATLQRVVKQKMTLDIHNWSSSAHQEIHKIVKDEIFPIVNQVDARVQNFKKQFLKEAAKFVRDFQSLTKEADESLAKHKALELEIERLLRAVLSQYIMSIVQNNSVVDTSNLQTKLEHTKERFENCIIKKENEYAKLWNDWYKKCEECKYDKISYDKAYNGMQQKIERLQAQLGDQNGKSKDTPCVSNTLDSLPQKLENENVELEFQVWNYEKENAHLKTTYKNLFDSIKVTRAQTKAIIDSLQDKLHDTKYENAKLRAQLFDKSNALSKPVTSNSAPSSYESLVVNNERVIAPGIFRINPFKASRVDNFVPNKYVKASVRTKLITVSQPHVVTKEDVNSNRNGFSPNNIEITNRTRRPQPRNNPKSDKYVNGMKSTKKNQSANVSNVENQKKHKPKVRKPKKSWKVYSVICSTNYSNGENQVVSKSSAVTTADASDKRQQQQDSTSSTSTLTTTITADGIFDL